MKHVILDKNPPKVSIIIPAFNAQNYIATTLNCLVNQNYKDIEFIVVDDGSTDNTKQVVEQFMFDRRLRYFKKENGGTGSALNLGHEMALGELVTWCSSDNVFFSDFVEIFVRGFDAIKSQGQEELIKFLYADFTYIDANGNRIGRDVVHKPIAKTDLVNGYDFGMCFMYTKDLWNKTGPYWNRICEDYEWAVRAMQHSDCGLISKIVGAFRVHGNQITGSNPEEEAATAEHCRQLAKKLLLPQEERVNG